MPSPGWPRFGIRVEAVMTDNAFCYVHRQYASALATIDLRHLRTLPYTPRTNGKAERFILTALRECAYAKPIAPLARVLARSTTS